VTTISPPVAPLVDRITDAFVTGVTDDLPALYRPDVLVDVIVPSWRFQLQGAEAVEALLTEEFLPGRRVTHWHRTATEDGLLLELEVWAPIDGVDRFSRAMHQFRVVDGAIAEHIVYCSGFWRPEDLARQAIEAPMVRQR
jgi:hypothetical protein